MTDNTQPAALMQLADAYADASFDQALHNRTLDDAPEIARSALAAAILRQHARIVELASQLESIGAGGVDGPHRAVQLVEVGTSAADYGHGPQSKTVQEAARHVGKWLNERPNRPLDLRDVAMLSAHAQVTASLLEDAERYRFLRGHCRSTSEHWGGRWSIIVDGPAPKSHGSEKDIDEAVDAARKQGANHEQ